MSEVADPTPSAPSDEPLLRLFEQVLAPLVAADGGELVLHGREGDAVEVSLEGACAGCPGRMITVERVLLPALRALDPSIRSVRVRH